MRTPLAVPAYVGPLTWDDAGWRSCPACDVEWIGGGPCFLDPAHAGHDGRLRSWCPHGLRRVPGDGERLCPACERHEASDFSPEFLESFALAADRALASLET
jgi:hypothetical protein